MIVRPQRYLFQVDVDDDDDDDQRRVVVGEGQCTTVPAGGKAVQPSPLSIEELRELTDRLAELKGIKVMPGWGR